MNIDKSAWIGLCSALALAGWITNSNAVTNTVQVRGGFGQQFTFAPSNIVIAPGDTILWTNVSTTTHDVTQGGRVGGVFATNPMPYWAMIDLALNGRSAVTFSNVGSYPYICVQHVITLPQPNAANPTQTGLVAVAIANLLPTVAITSPTNLSRFAAPASFSVTADAADPDVGGSISNVQFFAGTTLLGTDATAPYSVDLSNLAGGFYPLTARAVDNLGGASTSAVVNVLVSSNRVVNVGPGLVFTPNLLTVTVGDTVTFNGLASFHTVTGSGTVEPFCGNSLQNSCSVTFNSVGRFPFHCNPHRAFGMTGSVEVVGPNLSPRVRMTAPADGSVFTTNSVITLSADASDLFGRIASVRFFRPPSFNLGLDTESPYTVAISNLAVGDYVISALATDNSNLTSTSSPVNVRIIAPSPIQLLSPALGQTGFQFNFTADPGLSYVVEGSAADGSPVPFVPLATNTANTNLMSFTDPESASRSNRAYRVLRRP